MTTIVASIPRSGSRFTMEYVQSLGVPCTLIHVDDMQGILEYMPCNPYLVIPLRDPILVFTSNCLMIDPGSLRAPTDVPNVLEHVCKSWNRLCFLMDEYNAVTLNINCDKSERDKEFKKVADFLGKPVSDFKWREIGITFGDKPTDYKLWESVKRDFTPEQVQQIKAVLQPYRERFNYARNI